ncbi:MAG: peptide-methionine (S)-S-oxide reductase MsrA [Bacteroidetes bacterium]|nr:peptide-methionine (S)-S-oxide reductase MsrA [Bacteroidota bacterium]MBS1541469.1 peptide-methionine (S)-S-oxide reductase MsrA [Bacteroidota bacterium]
MKTKWFIVVVIFSVLSAQAQTHPSMESKELKKITLGAGCFWCTEAVYLQVNGVVKVVSGYAGGKVKNPTYREVCSGLTGHAEVTQITYDPKIISYTDLLEIFWNMHDPTTLNRQGADEGTQYRSVIFYNDEGEKKIAEQYKKQLDEAHLYKSPIVTEISILTNFYPAEDYHQNYYALNPNQGYCQYVIRPKVEKFKAHFASKLKK